MDFLSSSVPFIISLQKHTEWLPIMKLLSALGSTEFFLLALPLLYWCFNRTLGWQVGLLVIANATLNDLLKIVFGLPRPYWISSEILQLDKDMSFGLPSGHTQGSIVFWLFLALQIQNKNWRTAAVIGALGLVSLIATARMYLGVHFPADTIAGAIFGSLFLGLYLKFIRPWGSEFRRKPFNTQLLLALATPVACLILFFIALQIPHIGDTSGYAKWIGEARAASAIVARTGSLAGILLGLLLMGREQRFTVASPKLHVISRFLLGLMGVVILYLGLAQILKSLIPKGATELTEMGRFVRYFLLAWWITAGAPSLFLKMKLMSREGPVTARKGATSAPTAC